MKRAPRTRPTIGLLTDAVWSRRSSYPTIVSAGVADAARERDVNLICFTGGNLRVSRFDEFDAHRDMQSGLRTLDILDGLVISSGVLSLFLSHRELQDFCERCRPLPIVSIAAALDGVPSVLVDNLTGLRDAMDHLIETHGHRRIACIRGPEDHQEANARYRAYAEALAAHGLPLNPDLVVSGDFSNSSGAAAMRLLLDVRRLQPGVDFESFVTATDAVALGALDELQARGVQVPYDVAVVGFDDIAGARLTIPPLTTVRQPIREQTKRAVEILLARLAGEDVPEQVVLPTEMVVRQSCGCPSRAVLQVTAEPVGGTKVPRGCSAGATLEETLFSRREEIVAAMVEAVTSSAAEGAPTMTAEWAGKVLDSFAATMRNGAPRGFLQMLDQVLRQAAMMDSTKRDLAGLPHRSGERVSAWQAALSALRHHVLPALDSPPALLRAEDLWQQARVMIGEAAEQTEAYQKVQSEYLSEVLSPVGQALMTTDDMAELMDTLVEELPRLGIRSCCLYLYEDPKSPAKWSNLVLAYRDGERVVSEEGGRRFASGQLVPDGLFPDDRRYQLMDEPLYFGEDEIGFVLFEFEREAHEVELISETLRGQLSSALYRIRLLQTRRQAEEALAQERNLLRSLIDNVPDLIYVKDTESRFLTANPALARLIGVATPDELLGKTDFDFFPQELATKFYADDQAIFQSGQPVLELEEPSVDATGNERWVSTTKVPLRDAQGKIFGLVGMGRDITERKRAEEAVAEERNLLRTLIDNSPDYIYVKDAGGQFVVANMAVVRQMGFASQDELVGKSDWDLFPRELAARYYADEQAIMQSGQGLYDYEGPTVDVNREEKDRWVSTTKVLLRDTQGRITGFVGIGRDITERKRAEQALRETEERFRILFQYSPDGIVLIDPYHATTPWAIIDCNDSFCRMNGYSKEELIGQPIDIVNTEGFDDANRATHLEHLHRRYLELETMHRRKDGAIFPIEYVSTVVTLGGRELVLGIDRDVTERKRAEQEILQRNQELGTLNEIGRALSRLAEPSEILELIYTMVGRALDNRSFYIALYDEANQQLTFPIYTLDGQRLEPYTRPFANSITEYVIRTREPLLTNCNAGETFAKLGIQPLYTRAPAPKSLLCVPMIAGGKVIGAISVRDHNREYAYTVKQQELLSTIAAQAAIAIENARLFQETRQRAREFAALYDTSRDLSMQRGLATLLQTIVERARTLLAAFAGSIYLFDVARRDLEVVVATDLSTPLGTRLQLGEGIAGRVAQTGEPLIVNDYRTWPYRAQAFQGEPIRAIVEVPMLYGGELIGVLVVYELGETTRTFTDADARLLSLFAGQAASAVHNTRLLEETQVHAHRQEALYRVSTELVRLTAPRELCEAVVRAGQDMLGYDFLGIFLLEPETGDRVAQAQSGWDDAPKDWRLHPGEGLSEKAFLTGELQYWPDVTREPRYISGLREAHTELDVPIKIGNSVLGVLIVEDDRVDAFNPSDFEVLRAVANQLAVALENTRLFATVQQELTERKRAEEALQRRAVQLQAAAAVAREAAAIHDVDQLLDRTVHLISDEFGFYHAGIFLLREAEGYVLLQAASSEGGQRMLARGYRLKVGEGIVGHVAKTGEPRIAMNVGSDTEFFANPDLPDTRSEMALPLKLHGRVIGVLDVESTTEQAFSNEDVATLQTLADQLALAIQNSRLLKESQLTTELANQIVLASELDDLYRRVVMLLHQFDYHNVQLLRYDPPAGFVRPVAGYGADGPQKLNEHHPVPIGTDAVGKAAAIGISVLCSDATQDPNWQASPFLPKAKGELAVPIKLGKESPDSQVKGLNYFIDRGFDGLVVAGIEVDAIAPLTRKALNNGMAVVSLTSDLGADNQTALVWAIEHKLGRDLGLQAGEWAIKHIPTGQTLKVGVLNYRILPQVIQREDGIIEGIQEIFGENVEIVASETAGDPAQALPIAERWLSAYPDLNMIVGINDAGALGAYRAVIAAGRNNPDTFFVGGIDATDEALAALREGGAYQATVDQPPRKMGVRAVRTLVAAITGQPYQPVNTINCVPINRTNMDVFLANRKAIPAVDPAIEKDPLISLDLSHIKIGLSVMNLANPFFAAVAAEAKAEAERLGVGFVLSDSRPVWGVLDVQSTTIGSLDLQDQKILEGLCSQIAVGIDGLQNKAERERLLIALDRRSTRLQTAAEVSRTVTSILDISQVLPRVVDLIRERFQYYNVNVFLIDESGQWAELRAATDDAGQQLVKDGVRLPVGGPSIVGWVTASGQPHISQDVATDPLYLPVALLPETRAEAVIPLIIGGVIIGALDIESAQPNAFPPSLVPILTIIADQTAVAIQNAKLHAAEKAHARDLERAYDALRENQEKLLIAEKMASLGRLTAGIAHEMNTPLAAVRASLSELEKLATEYETSIGEPQVTSGDHREIAKEMKKSICLASTAAEHAASFVRGIKTQTRGLGHAEKQSFNAVQVIQETLLLLSHSLRKSNCTAVFEPIVDHIELYGSPGRLAQVITNLVTNSIDASTAKGGGNITISLVSRNREIELQVTDTGSGIAPENLSKIFDPMFTTKPFGQGTGLGLTIVHDIVVGEFGGAIDVSSQLGQGATFTLHFPRPETLATS